MRYYTQKTNRQLGERAIRLTCVTTQFSELIRTVNVETSIWHDRRTQLYTCYTDIMT